MYVRHAGSCPHREDDSYPRCDCPKALRWSRGGKQYRKAAGTRTWGAAEDKAAELQRSLDTGGTREVQTTQPSAQTIAAAIETFITAKRGEGVGPATISKASHQLGCFERFLGDRQGPRYFPHEITKDDVIQFRATWDQTWKSAITRQKAQQNLRAFIRHCCRAEHRDSLLEALGKPIKVTKEDKERLKPKPLTEAELKHLLAEVPKIFPDKVTVARVTALIHCMVSTGLAIRDTIQLERRSIDGGWLKIERQKTGKAVMQKLDAALHRELLAVTNGNPRYIFWNGTSLPTSATTNWQHDLRLLMKSAGLWIKGNLSHRFRDTAVDFWLGAGCSMTEVAAMLGDTVAIVEKHYADLASKRMEERLSKMPVRSWKPEEEIQ